MTERIHSVGIDYGGTWLRAAAVDAQGHTVASRKIPSPLFSKVPAEIGRLLKDWKATPLRFLVVGSRGVWKLRPRKWLEGKLQTLARSVTVLSDIEMAHGAAFDGKPGILVIAGTGSIALGRDGRGKWERAGGFGPQKGDEGSGYWIGKEYLTRQGKKTLGVRPTAQLAGGVIDEARKKDAFAAYIVSEAQGHLAALADELLNQLRFRGKIRIRLAGGLFNDKFFLKGFRTALKRELEGKSFEVKVSKADAALFAAKLPLKPRAGRFRGART